MTARPTLRQLQYLCALAEHGHFGRAAESCAVTQSAFSTAIAELESLLGATLVERSKRHVLVTPLGQATVERAHRVLREVDDLVDSVQAGRDPLAGPLKFGVIPTIGPYVLPRLMRRVRKDHPSLHLYLREERTETLLAKLRTGALDLVLLALPYELPDWVATQTVSEDRLMMACAATHRFAAKQRVTTDQLAGEKLLLLEDGHCLRAQALALCALAPADRNETFQGTSVRTLLEMVASGLGITLIPSIAAPVETMRGVAIKPLGPGRPARTIALAWRRTSGRAREYAQFAQLLRDEIDQILA
jgi:LysR family hydrogen peroxide-inducible transcriptional activator